MFIDGEGEMDIDGNLSSVKGGDVVCIEDGEYHPCLTQGT